MFHNRQIPSLLPHPSYTTGYSINAFFTTFTFSPLLLIPLKSLTPPLLPFYHFFTFLPFLLIPLLSVGLVTHATSSSTLPSQTRPREPSHSIAVAL